MDGPQWKCTLAADLAEANRYADVLQKVFKQAETTVGVSINTLRTRNCAAQQEIQELLARVSEKDQHIDELVQCIEELKHPPLPAGAPTVSIFSQGVQIREDMDEVLELRTSSSELQKRVRELEEENKYLDNRVASLEASKLATRPCNTHEK